MHTNKDSCEEQTFAHNIEESKDLDQIVTPVINKGPFLNHSEVLHQRVSQ